MTPYLVKDFNELKNAIHKNAVDHGWWEEDRSGAECIALMHSELSEALEFLRKGNGPDDHIPEYDGATVELADCIIRILDYAGRNNLPIIEALLAKHEYNKKRPYKHGKKF